LNFSNEFVVSVGCDWWCKNLVETLVKMKTLNMNTLEMREAYKEKYGDDF